MTRGAGFRAWLAGAGRVLRKDLALGPRSPVVLWALVLPIVATILIRGVFGSLFEPTPRMGVVDQGTSSLPAALAAAEGIEVQPFDDPATMLARVRSHDLDAGLVLQPGFDAAVRAGQRPELHLTLSGESLASNRLVLAVTTLDLIRAVEGRPSPVDVQVTSLGEAPLEVTARLIPLLVILAVAIAGGFVPAASLVEEKEHRTLDAVLVTPLTVGQLLTAKGLFGFLLAVATGVVTLVLNGAFGDQPLVLLLAVAVGAAMMAELGLLLGAWARNANTMFTAWKTGGILVIYPVIFYLWPDLPQWVGRLGPTWWFLEPVYATSVEGATAGDVLPELGVALLVCLALVPAVAGAGRWLERRLAAGSAGRAARTSRVRAGSAA